MTGESSPAEGYITVQSLNAFLQLKAITLSVISIFKPLTQMKQQCHQDSTPLVFIRYKATQKAMDTLRYKSSIFQQYFTCRLDID